MTEAGAFERVEAAAAAVRSHCGALPETAVVLGSGLGDFAETLRGGIGIPYTVLPHWPVSRVVGHAGRLVVGEAAGRRVAALSGARMSTKATACTMSSSRHA